MKNKIAIINPITDKTQKEIREKYFLTSMYLQEQGYNLIDTRVVMDYYTNLTLSNQSIINVPLYTLAYFIKQLSKCKWVYMCEGWKECRECKIKLKLAQLYDIEVIYEIDPVTGEYKGI